MIDVTRTYLRKTRHAYSMNKKRHILVNLERLEDETPLNSIQILRFDCENAKKNSKRALLAVAST